MLQVHGGDMINKRRTIESPKEGPSPLIEKVPEAKDYLSMRELKIRKLYYKIHPSSNQISSYSRNSGQQQFVGPIRGP